MKEKLFEALKQTYPQFGLGDELLLQYAESLASSGLVTDDNLSDVVKMQKNTLETIQKMNDKRAEEAATKARAKAEAAYKEAEKKKAEESQKEEEAAKKAAEGTSSQKEKSEDETPEWFKAYQSAQEKKYSEAIAQSKKLEESLEKLKSENGKYQAEKKAAERNSFIASEAKRLGVPEWRSKEGFNITDTMDEKAITEYLSVVANNAKANMLPADGAGFPKFDGKATKEEVDKIADNLLK